MMSLYIVRLLAVLLACLTLSAPRAVAQGGAAQAKPVEIPKTATTLEGLPSVRIETTEHGTTTRRELGKAEAEDNRLKVRVRDGRFFWLSREDKPLAFNATGEYTFLSSTPGSYIKLTKVNDRIEYVEHLNEGPRMITWIGELRIVLSK